MSLAVAIGPSLAAANKFLDEAQFVSKELKPVVNKYGIVINELSEEAKEIVGSTVKAKENVLGEFKRLVAISELQSKIDLDKAKENVLKQAVNPISKYNDNLRPIGGGKKFSLKHIQKGGRLAAKRTRKSINEFLNSSVTSSYIYDMVQNGGKIKSKRKRSNENKRSLKRPRR